MFEYDLEELQQTFPYGRAEFEDVLIAGVGTDPQTVDALSERVWGGLPDEEQPVSWFTVLLCTVMIFLCIVLTIGGT